MIKENLRIVEENIQKACDKAGRDRGEVTLIAVSKTKPVEDLMEAYDAGIRVFGENKVQELCDKMEKMPDDIHWHMIGHLQKNKVKYIVGRVDLIHGVDNEELAKEIPGKVGSCVRLTPGKALTLYQLLYELLDEE